MKEKQSIMVDMDEVIVTGGLLYLINEFLGTNYVESDFNDYYMQDIIPSKKEFFDFFITKNQYDYCKLAEGVVDALKELNDSYDIYIGTAYLFNEIIEESGLFLKQKFDYLRKNLPFLDPFKFVFLGDKKCLNCSIKIDDRVDNLTGAARKLLFTAYHNSSLKDDELKEQGIERVNNWDEIKTMLLKEEK